jgi:ATP-dependent exoDNAse (exonuclease V) beta subunit
MTNTNPNAGTGAGAGLGDAAARTRIREALDTTLFVSAGAGSGKTGALIDRIVATVLDGAQPVSLRHVAAVTFTEKAAAELRDRLRIVLSRRADQAAAGSQTERRAVDALDDLESAAIGTLHSFAQRILAEHSVQAELPPLIEVLDEVASGVAFEDRWTVLRAELLDDPPLATPLLLGLAAGMRLDDLRAMARAFANDWDLLVPRVLDGPPIEPAPPLDIAAVLTEARRLAALHQSCGDDTDRFLARLDALAAWADRLAAAPDDPAQLTTLGEAAQLSWAHGRKANWVAYPLDRLKSECGALAADAQSLRNQVVDLVLRRLGRRIAEATLQAARARRAEGRLEFHDLLVLARDLLRHPRHGPAVRRSLHQRYQRMLLDEFQDTDPIQVELAVRIAGGEHADAADWADVQLPGGRLFLVGDPKQSIYRFRRADIAAFLRAEAYVGDTVVLDTNFRTTAPVLDWVNGVFSGLIVAEPGMQAAYQPLRAHRTAPPAGPAVTVLGAHEHTDRPAAAEVRTREAADVAAAVHAALAERWQVHDGRASPESADGAGGRWRDVELGDITILVPARTSLPQLEDALDQAGVPYRAEASSLVYRSREVRDLLLAARAADDPSDALALVSALRSPVFGCGDDDLWRWHHAGGRWNLLAPRPDGVPADDAVAEAVGYLRRLHHAGTWLTPSELLTRLTTDRRMYETALYGPRPRDTWRRLRFVVDQARAWAETEHGRLRDYLAWAGRQGAEGARVAEAVLPETDTDAVRIMTVHAAKGLEFPVVILSGLSTRPAAARRGVQVLWPPCGGYQVRMSTAVQTGDFEVAKPIDEQMDHHERLRLLYVGCTRARDHLVVSLHRKADTATTPPEDRQHSSAELLARAGAARPGTRIFDRDTGIPAGRGANAAGPSRAVAPVPPFQTWHASIAQVRASASRSSTVSASELEGSQTDPRPRPAATHLTGEPADPGLAKNARDLDLPFWNKGRYGTAIGRAVHGVLQAVDLATGAGLGDAVASQALAEGVDRHADLVRSLAEAALLAPAVRRAAQRPHWRETYVGTNVAGRVLEGFIDLVYRDDDGLVIVDYKTDAVATSQGLDARTLFYRPQLAAYAAALHAATGQPVARCILVFLSPGHASERTIHDLTEAVELVQETVRTG